MSYTVRRVRAMLDVYVEFEGDRTIMVDYAPAPDDPIARALLDKNDATLLAAAQAETANGIL